ncbi:MAG: arsenate reductase ArsC [Candidatus Coatesbacteria bacterium]|nr:arsenate reductase ArsC [Candidatus Coatesbacteria bacterium]
MPDKSRVLFLCGSNSCRSQMAEGFLKALAGDRFEVQSAGASASFVHPLAIRVMADVGIDISKHRSKSLDEFIGQEFDYVIAVCADDTKAICPFFPGKAKHRLNWGFEDPAEAEGNEAQRVKVFESVRDQIASRIKEFLSGVL